MLGASVGCDQRQCGVNETAVSVVLWDSQINICVPDHHHYPQNRHRIPVHCPGHQPDGRHVTPSEEVVVLVLCNIDSGCTMIMHAGLGNNDNATLGRCCLFSACTELGVFVLTRLVQRTIVSHRRQCNTESPAARHYAAKRANCAWSTHGPNHATTSLLSQHPPRDPTPYQAYCNMCRTTRRTQIHQYVHKASVHRGAASRVL